MRHNVTPQREKTTTLTTTNRGRKSSTRSSLPPLQHSPETRRDQNLGAMVNKLLRMVEEVMGS
jgi:hypothetical protein